MIPINTRSLSGRLLLASLVVIPVFLGGTGWILQGSYERSLETAARERLKLQVLTLMAEAEFEDSLRMPEQLLEARFNQVNSGVFGLVSDANGEVLWRSPSSVTNDAAFLQSGQRETSAGEQGFNRSPTLYRYWYSVLWQTETGEAIPLVFNAMETTAPTRAQLASLRSSLVLWLGGATLALVLLQALVLLWGLRPLRQLAGDIAQIEAGQKQRLEGDYPGEVQPLTRNLNSLLQAEHQRRERTRNTLADLAHSLKTPLAVLRSADAGSPDFASVVREQSDRMSEIVAYQLQRASSGAHNLLRLIPIRDAARRLRDSLTKVYADKPLAITIDVPETCQFRGDERDLMELLGTLMDNACKYGRQTVRVSASGSGETLTMTVEDDGPGVPQDSRESILRRGVRADSKHPGQGIGLAVAHDIASAYGGRVAITQSALGGARVTVAFNRAAGH